MNKKIKEKVEKFLDKQVKMFDIDLFKRHDYIDDYCEGYSCFYEIKEGDSIFVVRYDIFIAYSNTNSLELDLKRSNLSKFVRFFFERFEDNLLENTVPKELRSYFPETLEMEKISYKFTSELDKFIDNNPDHTDYIYEQCKKKLDKIFLKKLKRIEKCQKQ